MVDKKVDEEIVYDLKVFQTHICPAPFVNSKTERLLIMTKLFSEFGVLPREGGYLQQFYDEIKPLEEISAFMSGFEAKNE